MPGGSSFSTVCEAAVTWPTRGDVDVRLEEDLDDAVAGQRLRFDVLDVADLRGQGAFIVSR